MDFTSNDDFGQRVEFLSPNNCILTQEQDDSYERLLDNQLKVTALNQCKSFADTQDNIALCSESYSVTRPIDHTTTSNIIGCESDMIVTNGYSSLIFDGSETSVISGVSIPTKSNKQDIQNFNDICNMRNTSIMSNSTLTVSDGRIYHSLASPESNNVVFKCISFMSCNSKHKIIFVQLKTYINSLTKYPIVWNSRCCHSSVRL